MPVDIVLVAEDVLSLAVLQKLVEHTGRGFRVYLARNEKGIGNIRKNLQTYRNASKVLPHVVLVDLDRVECPATLREEWGVKQLPQAMLFRVAVREIEAWVMADQQGFAEFCGVPGNRLSPQPEALPDPKQELLNLVRRGRKRKLIDDVVPMQGTPMSKGPLYNERLIQFVQDDWSVDRAAVSAPSLRRTCERIRFFLS